MSDDESQHDPLQTEGGEISAANDENHSNFSGEIKTKESSRKKQLRAFCVLRLPICGSNFLLLLLFVFTIRGR